MSVQEIEQAITELEPSEVAIFAEWFAEYRANTWDQQIEADVKSGKLDALVDEALLDHANGQTRPL